MFSEVVRSGNAVRTKGKDTFIVCNGCEDCGGRFRNIGGVKGIKNKTETAL